VQTGFNCYCKPGYYVSGTVCVKCEICNPLTHPGQYKDGCGKASAGECKKCAECDNPLQKRAGCGFFSAGECKDKDELVRTPFCPVEVEADNAALSISVRQASGLGAFSFEQVFGTDAQSSDFVCSQPCDGVTYDSIQCDGPFACNVKTCAELTRANELPRACPVVLEEHDLLPSAKSVRDRKRRESCVACNECGRANEYFVNGDSKTNYYEHWGGGCVRECSKLMCSENMIWDWTASRCQRCSELRDVRLCSKRDRLALSLEARSVTGNWPLLYFPECEGEFASKKLETFKYGICAVCDAVSDKAELCPSASEYPAGCDGERVACRACHRAGRAGPARLVDVFKAAWYNARGRAFEPLHCQIGACVDEAFTGVRDADRLCTTPCSTVVCAADQVAVPCRLPHDARCEPAFPALAALAARTKYADGEVNLLSEADDLKHRRFASFENAFVALGDTAYEYQCVWNADGIFDNRASPAGLSNVIWRPGRSSDEAYASRGTQVCRAWDVQQGVELPLLPLQNTIRAGAEQEARPASSRHMLVNTEAYVLSYRFDGAFAAPETTDVRGAFADAEFQPGPDMLRGAHVGGAGRLFLMLRMYEAQATVAVTVPSDRRLHEAMWLQALLVSFAVVDVSQYEDGIGANVTVSAAVTKDEKHISNLGDNFVLESFWVQNLSESESFVIGDDLSLFAIEVMDPAFETWTRCNTSDMLALHVLDMQVAPFLPHEALANYSWLEQHHGSAVPFNVSVACFKGEQLLAGAECHGVKSESAVYVRREPYAFAPASGSSGCADCGRSCSECTTDRALLGLRHVQAHTRGVRAEQHASSAGLVRYQLQKLSQPLRMLQAHAWQPFGRCAALVTVQNETHDAVVCIGDEISTLVSTLAEEPDRYFGAFGVDVGGAKRMIFMLTGDGVRLTRLTYQDESAQTYRMVQDTQGLSVAWISVSAEKERIVALGVDDNNQLEVGLYSISTVSSVNTALQLRLEAQPVALEVPYEIVNGKPSDPWLWYSRVAVCDVVVCGTVYLAAAVRLEQVVEDQAGGEAGGQAGGQAGGSRLVLYACAGSASGTVPCATAKLPVPADSGPAFISVAFLRADARHEHWVVGVYGYVFAVTTAASSASSANSAVVQTYPQSELSDQHFLRVDPLFYTFSVSGRGAASSDVLTYLDGFVHVNGNASLDVAYAVVVVPPSRGADVIGPAPVDDFTPPQPVLRLSMHRASYHVDAAGGPGLPVLERTGELAAGNESTQLLVSQHAVAPFAQRRAGFMASYEDTGLNKRITLPRSHGRYEMREGECVFAHARTSSTESGLRLRMAAHSTEPWLLLQFEVQCGTTLLVSCNDTTPPPWQERCADSDVVLLVLETTLTKATVYFLEDGALASEPQPPAACVFLGAGAAWVNSVAFASEPALPELLRRLRRSAELQRPSAPAPLASSWRRERRVLTLNPVENMRVEVTFRRDALFSQMVSVGVDDVQLAPVLSFFPPLRGVNVLCAPVRVPTAAELRGIGLNSLIADDHWQRVHVTISLETAGACAFVARLYRAGSTAECPAASVAPNAVPNAARSGLERAGCRLQTDAAGVRTPYAECQVEVPLGMQDLGVAVRPEPGCALGTSDSLVVWLRPHTALYSCPTGQFLDAEGVCVNCQEPGAQASQSSQSHQCPQCALGERLAGCPALEQRCECVECTEGAAQVAIGVAHWVQSDSGICAWECSQDFFRVEWGCANCSAQQEACPPGQRWQACSERADAGCVACPDLRLTKGSYAANEQWVGSYLEECESECRAGFYNDTAEFADGRCKRCWDRTELVLHASLEQQFFAFSNCTAKSNAAWAPCRAEPGARVIGSDPGAGTAADPFTGRCEFECVEGWRRRSPAEAAAAGLLCEQCAHPRRILLGNVTALPLEQRAFEWQAESCAFSCLAPWRSTRARSSVPEETEDTCVLCEAEDGSFLCPDGKYPAGPYCTCETCDNL
jgi:hypothetical protein